jgi:hypothetical protein
MTKTIKFVIYFLFALPILTFGQRKSVYKIDTANILANRSLNSFAENLKKNSFSTFNDKNAIPPSIKRQLRQIAKGFSIANPGRPWQCCCTSPRRLPARQLIFLAKSQNILAISYLTGGRSVSNHLLLLRFDNGKITDLWTGYCEGNVHTVSDIIAYVEESKNKNQGFNTIIL